MARAKRGTDGQLSARPGQPTRDVRPGRYRPGLGTDRDGLLYVPAGYDRARPAPLAVLFHGAGGSAGHGLSLLERLADAAGLVLLAPDARTDTWDVLVGEFGPDVAFLDLALDHAVARCPIDPGRVAVGGFSDGASSALSVGLCNGDLFTHVLAFSPGFMAPAVVVGEPRVYVSHGTRDEVLPVGCSWRIVLELERARYDVRYHEFDGPHPVPEAVTREAVD